MEEAQTLLLYELHYDDLILLSDHGPLHSSSSSSGAENKRLQLITTKLMENLGPSGPGLISITGIPNASSLRRTLLPLARKLALLNNDDRKRIFKEHNLGSDVPLKNLDRVVSSFAMQLKYSTGKEKSQMMDEYNTATVGGISQMDTAAYEKLGSTFMELGFCMMEVGLCLARICDYVMGGNELERSLLESGTAKARLIHYHSSNDNVLLKQAANGKAKRRIDSNKPGFISGSRLGNDDGRNSLWQEWHYDYGVFTVLTVPMFMSSDVECGSPNDHTYLQVFDSDKNNVHMVKASPDSFIVQVGESADVLSKGKLRATLHCVCQPENMEYLSRENFVVFLQPAWTKTFSLSGYPVEKLHLDGKDSGWQAEGIKNVQKDVRALAEQIRGVVPPLSLRLRDGMTFAEFARETTKQYYGGNGLQSNR